MPDEVNARRRLILRRWVPFGVLAVTCTLSAVASWYVAATLEARQQADIRASSARFLNDADNTRQHIEVRLNTYIEVIRAGAALMAASNELTPVEFRAFVAGLSLSERFPGMQAMGFAPRVQAQQVQAFRQMTTLDGVTRLREWEPAGKTEYFPVLYLEPRKEAAHAGVAIDLSMDEVLREAMQRAAIRYDKAGEEHYNLISAFIKSIRNSDADAAVYWLARMLEAGEAPLFIARRMVIHASEDIGLGDPHALTQAVAAMQATHFVGLPEAKLALTQAAIYLSLAPKSNAVIEAYISAQKDALETERQPVPLHLRNAATSLMRQVGYGKGYQYAHMFESGRAEEMECLPEGLRGRKYYKPNKRDKVPTR